MSADDQINLREGLASSQESLSGRVPESSSLTDASPDCPNVYGGGNHRQESKTQTTMANAKTDKDYASELTRDGSTDDGSSDSSMVTVESVENQHEGRLRLRSANKRFYESDASDDEVVTKNKTPRKATRKSTRGRGRPPTTGQYVGLAKAKAALNAAKREELKLRAEEEIAAATASYCRSVSRLSESSADISAGNEDDKLCVAKVVQDINKSLSYINEVGRKSKNIKGELLGGLKKATAAIADAVLDLSSRTESQEVKRLEAKSARQQAEIEELRRDVEQLRAAMREAQCPAAPIAPIDIEEICRQVMVQTGNMVNARLEVIEERLLPERRLRPSLAADRTKVPQEMAVCPVTQAIECTLTSSSNTHPERPHSTRMKTKAPVPTPSVVNDLAVQGGINEDAVTGKKRKKKKAKSLAARHEPDAEHDEVTAIPSINEGWQRVTSRKATKKMTRAQSREQPKAQKDSLPKTKNVTRKLRTPRSAAVVLKLQPEAIERGLTYAQIISQAKEKINLSELEITKLRFKRSVTGGRVLEIPGVANDGKANSLAEKLKETLDSELVKVTRPTKSAELRISNLDDSVSSAEVAATVARLGECDLASITCGEVRRGYTGLGSVWLRCPVSAAKSVLSHGRFLIGWSSARVELLDARPFQCFRCLESGHVQAFCTSDVDRSSLCYRCGVPGHKAGNCLAKPHCTVCAAAGKPANHRSGRKTCSAISSKRKTRDHNAPSSRVAPKPSGAEEQIEMDTIQTNQ